MTISSQAPANAFQACLDEALQQSAFLMDRWCSKLVSALYERSLLIDNAPERHQLQTAIAALRKNRPAIERDFPGVLKKAIDADLAPLGAPRKTAGLGRSLSSVSFEELELMGDSEVNEAVESARLQQVIKLQCEAGLASFSARLSAAQGLPVVKADSNPLRPEIMGLALLRLLESLAVTSRDRAAWLLDGARVMGEELQSLYLLLNDFLTNRGIAPAAYGVVASPESRAGANRGAAPRAAQAYGAQAFAGVPSQYAPASIFTQGGVLPPDSEPPEPTRSQLLTLDHLHHLLVGDYEAPQRDASAFPELDSEAPPAHRDFSHTVPAALDMLSELEEKGLVSTRAKLTRRAPSEPVAQLRARFKSGAKTLGQSVAIEVVGLMLEQIAHDERLLAPVRQVVAGMEPAFLRLALTDPRFFSDRSHPARKLLETITSTSLGYASQDAPGCAEFLQNLQEVALMLGDSQAGDAEHFTALLHDFERKENRNTPQARQAQRRAVQALLQAEQRNLMAVTIAAEMRARPDFSEGNRIVTAFLTGAWAQVMARERLMGAAEGGQAPFAKTLDDVLWSIGGDHAPGHRQRLVQRIPGMLQSLRQGLVSIDFPLEQSRPFFDELMRLHQATLKPRPETSSQPASNVHALEKMFVASEKGDAVPLWLAPSEVQHSGFMDDWDGPSVSGPEEELLPAADMNPAVSGLAGLGEGIELNLGDWVDLFMDMQWLRAQLTWISPRSTLFMFTSGGGRKHSMTSRVLKHLLTLNLVKVVSQQGVVEGALDNVARTAMQNSVKGKGGL